MRSCAQRETFPAYCRWQGLCANPDHLSEVIASLADPQAAALVIEGSSSRIRQAAAQRIENPAELSRLLKLARDKDKSVYKILKQKYDALRAEEERIAQIESDVNGVCGSLERLSHRPLRAAVCGVLR